MNIRRIVIFLIVVILVVIAIVYAKNRSKNNTTTQSQPTGQTATSGTSGVITVALSSQNNSGESGTATLADIGNNQTRVDLVITGQPDSLSQPAHIHSGTCANLGDILYPLVSPANGKSETIINASLSKILSQSPVAVNVHKSAADINTYVACGDVPQPSASGGTSAPAAAKTFNISGSEYSFMPSTIQVNKGDQVTVNFTNTGTFPHNWTLDEFNAKTNTISPGQSTSVTFTAARSGTFQFYCSVPGHRDRGMVGELVVK